MRVVSHTASNTEIVCALGCEALLVGIDADSDYPPDVHARVPKLGRDLNLDLRSVEALRPDLVLTSLTVPGHEVIVAALNRQGIPTLVADPIRLDDVFDDIGRIAAALGVAERGAALVREMRAAMPQCPPRNVKVLVEWWPKPVIVPGRDSWINDLLRRAGARNPWEDRPMKSQPVTAEEVAEQAPDVVIPCWCGVPEHQLRPANVLKRPGWSHVPAVRSGSVWPISEAYLGRPGPRLVEGYRQLVDHLDRLAA